MGLCDHLFMPSWCFFVFFLSVTLFPVIPACPGIQQSSIVMHDFGCFRTLWLVGICFCRACRQVLEYVIRVKLFPFVEDFAFRVRCIAWVSAKNMELNLGSDADYVRFPVVAAPHTSISLLSILYIHMCFHPMYLFSTTSSNLFWYTKVGSLSFERSVRDKFILVLESAK